MVTPFPRRALDGTISQRFREQVALHPERPAVRYDGVTLSYAALMARASAIATELRDRAGNAGGAVALLTPQGIDQIAAILAVLDAGCWYVPLDPAERPEVLAALVARAEARAVLATAATEDVARDAAGSHASVLRVDGCATPPAVDPGPAAVGPDALAYVYFTSGTTGPPKGVMDSHRNVIHNVLRYSRALDFCPEDRLSLVQASHFSGAVSNVFGALLNGAMLLPYDVTRDGAGPPLAAWIAREQPTVFHSVASLFRSVCLPGARFPSVRVVRIEGDSGAPADAERFAAHFTRGSRLVHGLGATETGICSQFFVEHGERVAGDVLPIGADVEDMEVRLLDERGAPVAPGEAGEIAVRSRFLALGYWRDPERTASAFRVDPSVPGLREYWTGDVGRRRPDGALEHLGRRDQRLRVRGLWVDAARVEARLCELPGVREAAVALLRDGDDAGALAAYMVLEDGSLPSMRSVRRAVAGALPVHAVPRFGYAVAALPLGAHGKLDRRALDPRLGPALPEGAGDAPARDPLESELLAIWKEVLGLEPIGIHDPFVELGGDSLSAAVLILRIQERLGYSVTQSILAEAPTIAELAARLSLQAGRPASHSRVPLRVSGSSPPLFCVHDLDSDAFLFSPLATRLGAGQRVYGLRHPAGEPVARLPHTLEALAGRYLADITAVAPRGPYALAGFCFGGTVALEMARLLAARGEPVALLALINVTAYDLFALASPRARARFRRRWGARLRYLWLKRDALAWTGRRLQRAALDVLGRATLGARLAALPAESPASPTLLRAVLRDGFARHRPRPHAGSLVLFLAEETLPLYADDPHEAWSGLATGAVEIHRLPHDGYAMLSEPDVAEVARVLRRHLTRLEPPGVSDPAPAHGFPSRFIDPAP